MHTKHDGYPAERAPQRTPLVGRPVMHPKHAGYPAERAPQRTPPLVGRPVMHPKHAGYPAERAPQRTPRNAAPQSPNVRDKNKRAEYEHL
ncbi:hypothetical protein StoSoilB20_42350 [Arthrobacter sp. StoSoilB20]|nr:hypothetical protein StoSoilB20_42350 [Arthrobacter sp. StoSoilB20]